MIPWQILLHEGEEGEPFFDTHILIYSLEIAVILIAIYLLVRYFRRRKK